MQSSLEELDMFLAEKRDSREYRRGVAVKMALKGYLYEVICDVLNVSPGFISQWKNAYESHGVAELTLHYKGSQAYLTPDQRDAVIAWMRSQTSWSVDQLKTYLETTYDVVFQSRQSYYELLDAAGITLKKAQRSNPAKNPEIVAKKKEITERLLGWRKAIEAGELIVMYVDECHLIWDDARGYVWGKANERITIDMTNFRQRQTYYGAIEQYHGEITIIPAPAGNGESTVAFIQGLHEKYPDKRFVLIWDGASYHTGEEMRTYLQEVNNGLEPDEWLVTCLRFAPNAPEQNPMEDIWLKGKRFVRKNWFLCDTFRKVKELFMQSIENAHVVFDKLFMYAPFLEII